MWSTGITGDVRGLPAQLSCTGEAFDRLPSKGSRGQFREEDQLCCAWIAEGLLAAGYEAENAQTLSIVERWSGAPLEAMTSGASTEYLRKTGQTRDLDFILAHVNDLDEIYRFERGQVIKHAEEVLLR